MTEAEWMVCDDSSSMWDFMQGKASGRKLRLFGCACCRRVWELMPNVFCTRAVVFAEFTADGRCATDELYRLSDGIESALRSDAYWDEVDQYFAALAAWRVSSKDYLHMTAEAAAVAIAVHRSDEDYHPKRATEGKAQADLIRDIFGNPFRPATFDPSWLTSTVTALAAQMYDSRDFSAMPILADALQDAGCTNDDILNHCRGDGPHVRGCWVVDLVLGKG